MKFVVPHPILNSAITTGPILYEPSTKFFFFFLGSPVQRFNRMKKKNMKFWKEKYILGILKYWPGRQKKKTKKGIEIM